MKSADDQRSGKFVSGFSLFCFVGKDQEPESIVFSRFLGEPVPPKRGCGETTEKKKSLMKSSN